MKRCTYCGKEYPDEAEVCAIDQQRLESGERASAKTEDRLHTAPEITARGQLSIGSFIKLSVIAAIGCLPVLAALCCLAFLVGLARGHHTASSVDFPILVLWPLLLLRAVYFAMTTVISGFFAGLFGYPFYSWLCRRRRGIILKGKFEVL